MAERVGWEAWAARWCADHSYGRSKSNYTEERCVGTLLPQLLIFEICCKRNSIKEAASLNQALLTPMQHCFSCDSRKVYVSELR